MIADAVFPVTAERWGDLERLFGPSGAYSGCWCMWLRCTAAEFSAAGNAGNRAALRDLVLDGREPGLLAYRAGVPVGWVSVGPRTEFGRILRSPLFAPTRIDGGEPEDPSVWSIVCYFVPREERGRGLMRTLTDAAVEHARRRGARVVEAYPLTEGQPARAADLFVGSSRVLEDAGFRQVASPSPRRRVHRLELADHAGAPPEPSD